MHAAHPGGYSANIQLVSGVKYVVYQVYGMAQQVDAVQFVVLSQLAACSGGGAKQRSIWSCWTPVNITVTMILILMAYIINF